MSIAHYFTLLRLFIGPIFLFLYTEYAAIDIPATCLPYLLIAVLVISELSDAIDGYLARRLNQVSDLGKILDPMADSISRLSVFLTYTLFPVNLPLGLIFILLYRDLLVSTLRTICALKGIALGARPSGKMKAVIQAASAFVILFLMIAFVNETIDLNTLQKTSFWVASAACFYTLFSGVDYFYAHRHTIGMLLAKRQA